MSLLNSLDLTVSSNNAELQQEKSASISSSDSKVQNIAQNCLNKDSEIIEAPQRSYSTMEIEPSKTTNSTQRPTLMDRMGGFFKQSRTSLKAEVSKTPERVSKAIQDTEVGKALVDASYADTATERAKDLGSGALFAYSAGTSAAKLAATATGAAAKQEGSEHLKHMAEIVAVGAGGAVVVDDLFGMAKTCVKAVENKPKSTEEKQELAGKMVLNTTQLVQDGLSLAKSSVILSQGAVSGAATALSIAAPAATIPVQLVMIGLAAKGIHDDRRFMKDAREVLATIPQDGSFSFGEKGTAFVNNVVQFLEKYIDTEITPAEKQELERLDGQKQFLEQQTGKHKELERVDAKIERLEKRIKKRQYERFAKLIGQKAAKEAFEWLEGVKKSSTDSVGAQVEGACGIMLNVMRKSWRRQTEKKTSIACSGTMIAGAALAPVTHGASLGATGAAVVGFKLADLAFHLNAKLADATSKKEPWSPQKRDEILSDLRMLAETHDHLKILDSNQIFINNAEQMTDAQIIELSENLIEKTDDVLEKIQNSYSEK